MSKNLWDGMEGDEADHVYGERHKYPSYAVNMVPGLMIINGILISLIIGLIYLSIFH